MCILPTAILAHNANLRESESHPLRHYFLFSSALQFVITFKGSVLASGATLPINRGPFLVSTSNTARVVVVRKGERNSGCTSSTTMLVADACSLASSTSPALLTKYNDLLSAPHTGGGCIAPELICHFPRPLGKAVTKISLGPNSVVTNATHFPSGDTLPSDVVLQRGDRVGWAETPDS